MGWGHAELLVNRSAGRYDAEPTGEQARELGEKLRETTSVAAQESDWRRLIWAFIA